MLNKHQSQKLENEFSIAQTNKEYFKGMPVEITCSKLFNQFNIRKAQIVRDANRLKL